MISFNCYGNENQKQLQRLCSNSAKFILKYALVWLGVSNFGSTLGAIRNPAAFYPSRLGKHTYAVITN